MKWGVKRGPPYPINEQPDKPRKFETITQDGIDVKLISHHAKDRSDSRDVKDSEIIDAIRNPMHVDPVRYDKHGRPSIRYIGRTATVNLNPDNGIIPTVWKTGELYRKKYG